MTEELWNKHTPGDPMPCKCGDSVVEVRLRSGSIDSAGSWIWDKDKHCPDSEITDWRFVERKGEDVIADDPYAALEWDEDGIATVVLKEPGQPWWVRDDNMVRFSRGQNFAPAREWHGTWVFGIAFQIKRCPVLTPAVPQVLEMLAVAIDDEADAIRACARRANIEVPQ